MVGNPIQLQGHGFVCDLSWAFIAARFELAGEAVCLPAHTSVCQVFDRRRLEELTQSPPLRALTTRTHETGCKERGRKKSDALCLFYYLVTKPRSQFL